MIEEAVTKLGLTYNGFMNMTIYQYRLHIEHVLFERSKQSEHTRQICYMVYCAIVPKNERLPITEFMPLFTDKDIVAVPEKQIDLEEINRIKLLAEQRMRILQNK